MKRIAIVLALVPALAGAADIAPGTFELSGASNLGLNGGSIKTSVNGFSDTTDTSNYGLSATGLYYVTPNVAIGGTLQYLSDTTKFSDGTKDSTSTFLIGPAIAYEVPVAPEFAVFGLFDIGYVSQKNESGGASITASGFGLGLQAGVKYFPVKQVSFDAALGYQYASTSTDTTPKADLTTTGFGLNAGLSVYFK